MAATMLVQDATQGFVIFTTCIMFIFFAYEYCQRRAKWEVLFVSVVEALVYIMSATVPADMQPLFGPTGSSVTRYMSWMATCPVLIKVMINTVSIDPSITRMNQLVAADILMNACGVFAIAYDDSNMSIKMAFFCVGCIFAVFIISGVWKEFDAAKERLDRPCARKALMGLMLLSWTMFPVFYLLGPEMYGVVTKEMNVTFHSIGDLIAKNAFSFFAWRINQSREIRKGGPRRGSLFQQAKALASGMGEVPPTEEELKAMEVAGPREREYGLSRDERRKLEMKEMQASLVEAAVAAATQAATAAVAASKQQQSHEVEMAGLMAQEQQMMQEQQMAQRMSGVNSMGNLHQGMGRISGINQTPQFPNQMGPMGGQMQMMSPQMANDPRMSGLGMQQMGMQQMQGMGGMGMQGGMQGNGGGDEKTKAKKKKSKKKSKKYMMDE